MFKISKEKQLEINEFLKNNIAKYPKNIQLFIKERLYTDEDFVDVILQIYSYKNAILNELNPYYQFVDLLKSKFPSLETKKITEVACGFIPALSLALNASIQKQDEIHVYDPQLIDLSYKNIINYKENFHENSEPNADLLISDAPCDATEIIINTAIKRKLEMAIQTCICSGNMMFYSYRDFMYYVDFLCYRLQQLEDSGFKVEKEKTDYSRLSGCPVILVRKRM